MKTAGNQKNNNGWFGKVANFTAIWYLSSGRSSKAITPVSVLLRCRYPQTDKTIVLFMKFTRQTPETAPDESKELLKKVLEKFGFIPNQDKILAIAPSIYQAYNQSFDLFLGKSGLGLLGGQIVMMTTSYENNSPYCVAVHTWGMEMTKVPKDIIESLRTGKPIQDSKLEILRDFTKKLVLKQGHLEESDLKEFFGAGYTQENVIEIIGGISAKLISNYTNVIAGTELDEIMKPYEWVKE